LNSGRLAILFINPLSSQHQSTSNPPLVRTEKKRLMQLLLIEDDRLLADGLSALVVERLVAADEKVLATGRLLNVRFATVPHPRRHLNKSEHSRHTSRATQIPQQRQTFALSNTAVKSSVHKVSTKVVQDHRRLTFALANFTRASYE
jgi:hypothetical protein